MLISIQEIRKVYAIHNPCLIENFENARGYLAARHTGRTAEFNRDWHEVGTNLDQRQHFMNQLNGIIHNYNMLYLNNEIFRPYNLPPLLPMIHGANENSAWPICSNGFGTVSKLDEGWYGTYAAPNVNEGGAKPFILALVCPGNVFPVTEHPQLPGSCKGQACKTGFQSHYTVVQKQDGLPFMNGPVLGAPDELIVFQEAQAVPLFVFYA